jgi:hypothetical protein
MIVSALTVSKSFSLHLITRNNWFAASPRVSGGAVAIITTPRFVPTHLPFCYKWGFLSNCLG